MLEENIRHIGIEMLAGVDDGFPDAVVGTDGQADGGYLTELQPSTECPQNDGALARKGWVSRAKRIPSCWRQTREAPKLRVAQSKLG